MTAERCWILTFGLRSISGANDLKCIMQNRWSRMIRITAALSQFVTKPNFLFAFVAINARKPILALFSLWKTVSVTCAYNPKGKTISNGKTPPWMKTGCLFSHWLILHHFAFSFTNSLPFCQSQATAACSHLEYGRILGGFFITKTVQTLSKRIVIGVIL